MTPSWFSFLFLACTPVGTSDTGGTGTGTTTGTATDAVFVSASAAGSSPTEIDLQGEVTGQGRACLSAGTRQSCATVSGAFTLYLAGLSPDTAYDLSLTLGGVAVWTGSASTLVSQGAFTVLFDRDHGEQEGNADWVIDDDHPDPEPSSPGSETAWNGAYSSFGYDLWSTGRYTVTSTSGELSQDALSGVDVLVLPEPNTPLSAAEQAAVVAFVAAGGGLFYISDHDGADRDGDGYTAVDIGQSLLLAVGCLTTIDATDVDQYQADNINPDAGDPVVGGPFGSVAELGFFAAATLSVTGDSSTASSAVVGLVWRNGYDQDTIGLLAARERVGTGRVVIIGDSSPADDGTAAYGNQVYDSWHDQDNAAFFLNATAWLAGDPGS